MSHHGHNHDDCVECLAERVKALEARANANDEHQAETVDRLEEENERLREQLEGARKQYGQLVASHHRIENAKAELEKSHQRASAALEWLGVISIDVNSGRPVFAKGNQICICEACSAKVAGFKCDRCRSAQGDFLPAR